MTVGIAQMKPTNEKNRKQICRKSEIYRLMKCVDVRHIDDQFTTNSEN